MASDVTAADQLCRLRAEYMKVLARMPAFAEPVLADCAAQLRAVLTETIVCLDEMLAAMASAAASPELTLTPRSLQ